MKITLKALVAVANLRMFSMLPERAWKERTNINPTVQAIEYVTCRALQLWLAKLLLALGGICSGLTFFAFYRLPISDPTSILAVWGCIILVMSGFLQIVLPAYPRTKDSRQAESFCADLEKLRDWLHVFRSLSLWEYDDEFLKTAAREILVQTALLNLEVNDKPVNSHTLHDKSEFAARMQLQYDTLQRLGLASGGYDKYYKEARERIAKELTAIDGM